MKKLLKGIGIFFACVILIGGCMSAMGGNSKSSSTSPTTSSMSTSNSSSTSSDSAKKAEAPKKQETLQQQAFKDSSVSTEYKNALKKGIMYANEMHMSKAGVYQQLTSEYGEKFPAEAAKWAVEHMSDIDWNKNALEKAKMYQKEMSMSRADIQQQLTSEYGEKFTQEEAAYAMQYLGN